MSTETPHPYNARWLIDMDSVRCHINALLLAAMDMLDKPLPWDTRCTMRQLSSAPRMTWIEPPLDWLLYRRGCHESAQD